MKRQVTATRHKKGAKLDETKRIWYSNGTRYAQYSKKNGKREGLYRKWHRTGQLYIRGIYRNGKRVGLWSEWFCGEAHQLCEQGKFENDKRVGTWQEWWSDGLPAERRTYEDGKLVQVEIQNEASSLFSFKK